VITFPVLKDEKQSISGAVETTGFLIYVAVKKLSELMNQLKRRARELTTKRFSPRPDQKKGCERFCIIT